MSNESNDLNIDIIKLLYKIFYESKNPKALQIDISLNESEDCPNKYFESPLASLASAVYRIDLNAESKQKSPTGEFDAVILHKVIDKLAFQNKKNGIQSIDYIFNICHEILNKNGIILGCTQNRYGINAAINKMYPYIRQFSKGKKEAIPYLPLLSVHSCVMALKRANFQDIKLWNIFPNPDMPKMLQSIKPSVHKPTNLWHLELSRTHMSKHSRLFSNVASQLGINQYFANYIFFEARKNA